MPVAYPESSHLNLGGGGVDSAKTFVGKPQVTQNWADRVSQEAPPKTNHKCEKTKTKMKNEKNEELIIFSKYKKKQKSSPKRRLEGAERGTGTGTPLWPHSPPQ